MTASELLDHVRPVNDSRRETLRAELAKDRGCQIRFLGSRDKARQAQGFPDLLANFAAMADHVAMLGVNSDANPFLVFVKETLATLRVLSGPPRGHVPQVDAV